MSRLSSRNSLKNSASEASPKSFAAMLFSERRVAGAAVAKLAYAVGLKSTGVFPVVGSSPTSRTISVSLLNTSTCRFRVVAFRSFPGWRTSRRQRQLAKTVKGKPAEGSLKVTRASIVDWRHGRLYLGHGRHGGMLQNVEGTVGWRKVRFHGSPAQKSTQSSAHTRAPGYGGCVAFRQPARRFSDGNNGAGRSVPQYTDSSLERLHARIAV